MANKVEEISYSNDFIKMLNGLITTEKELMYTAMCVEANRNENVENSHTHYSQKHTEILNLYCKSMALAPTNLEELALAYGIRAAFLCHMKKYKESIRDCERALDITDSDYLQAKLLYRKAKCLAALNDKLAKYVCEEALELFKQLTIDEELKSNFIEKLKNIKNTCLNNKSHEKTTSTKKQQQILNV